MRLHEEFGLSVSDDTIYRVLKDLGFSHVSARPKAYKQDAEAMEAFKKTSPSGFCSGEDIAICPSLRWSSICLIRPHVATACRQFRCATFNPCGAPVLSASASLARLSSAT
jgi:hypothetical protein